MTRNKIMSKHVNLFYIDLDNFKKINDEYGHQAGDTVLVMVAGLLKQTFGAEFIARVGGRRISSGSFRLEDRCGAGNFGRKIFE